MTHQSPHDKAADAVHEGRPVKAAYVRGGGRGRRILTILVVSVSAVAVLLLGMWVLSFGGFAGTEPDSATQKANVEAFDGTGAAPPATPAPR